MFLQLDLWSVADANNHLFKLPTLVDMLHELLAPYAELRLTPGALHNTLHDTLQRAAVFTWWTCIRWGAASIPIAATKSSVFASR
jgi:hypothetical protein